MPLQAQEPPAPPKTDLERAELHFKSGEFPQAEKLLTASLAEHPNGPDAARSYLLLGDAQMKQNQADQAVRTYAGMVFRFSGTEPAAQAIERQAVILLQRKNASAAQKLRDRLLESYPDSPTTALVWTRVADAYFNQQEFAKATAIYEKIGKALSTESQGRLTIARILAEGGGDPRHILPIADKALAENDRKLATVLYEQLEKSPKAGKDLPKIKTKLGWCLYLEAKEESHVRAEKLWSEVIRSSRPSDPWYAEARWHLVQLAAGPQNDWKKAVALCDTIVREQAPGTFPHEQALFAKAWMLTVREQGKAAVAAFDDLAAAYPEKMRQPPIQEHLKRAMASAAKATGGQQ